MSRPVSRNRLQRRHPSRGAFTLLELMVVVGVIAIVAAAAAPAIGEARADAHTNEVANDIVRTLRRARSAAAGYGRAHLMVFDSSGDGNIYIFRGINNRCNANDWALLAPGACAGNEMCIDAVESAAEARGGSTYRIGMPDFPDGMQVCFEPTGITRWRRNVALNFTSDNADTIGTVNGGFRFTVQRRNSSGDRGVQRRVVLPLGSDARVAR